MRTLRNALDKQLHVLKSNNVLFDCTRVERYLVFDIVVIEFNVS